MPNRSFNAPSYKYGFNGKENDNEVVGTGEGTQDYGARIYNPTLGRWLSLDPLQSKYPEMSPYNFSGNSPICFKDIDGKKIFIYYDSGNRNEKGDIIYSQYEYGSKQKVPDNKFVQETLAAFAQINQVTTSVDAKEPSPSDVLNKLASDDKVTVNVKETTKGNSQRPTRGGSGNSSDVSFNPSKGRVYASINSEGKVVVDAYVPPSGGLSHELKHSYNYLFNPTQQNTDLQDNGSTKSLDKNVASFPNEEEHKTSILDNSFLNYFCLGSRKAYYIDSYNVNSSTSNIPIVTPENIKGSGTSVEIKNNSKSVPSF
jgi:RHS repeat-associated protein